MSGRELKRNEISTKSILKKDTSKDIVFQNSPLASPERPFKEMIFQEGDTGKDNVKLKTKSIESNDESVNSSSWTDAWTGTECLNKCDILNIFKIPTNISNLSGGNDISTVLASLESSNPKTDINNVVILLERLMSDFGLPAFAFLPTSSRKASVGKKCAVWNKSLESKVEIRIRTGAELRRLRFNWEDVLVLQIGPRIVDFQEDQDNDEAYDDGDYNSVQSKTITEKKRFVSCEVRGKGFVDLFFATEKLTSAVFHGWSHLVKNYKAKAKSNDKLT